MSKLGHSKLGYDGTDLDSELGPTHDSQQTDREKQRGPPIDREKQRGPPSKHFLSSQQRFVPYCPSETRKHSQSKTEQKAWLSMQTSANEQNFSKDFHDNADYQVFHKIFVIWFKEETDRRYLDTHKVE